jgi:hypothetical protein
MLRRPEEIAILRGLTTAQIAPRAMVEGVEEAEVAMAAKRAEVQAEASDAS